MASALVAIHQPNFFPWLGFFDKAAQADVFVLLDHVQFAKKGGTWTNRVRIITGGDQAGWITVPVDRSYHGTRAINEMQIDDGQPWRAKLLKTIRTSYGRAPHFEATFPLLESLINDPTRSLADFNEAAIRALLGAIGLEGVRVVSSSSLEVEGRATDLLIEIVGAVGGDAYLAGGGADEYQEPEKFERAGIELRAQGFQHPVYAQRTDRFVEGLSVIDALMACGTTGTRDLLFPSR